MTVTWQCPVASDNWKVTYGSAGNAANVTGPSSYVYDRSDGYNYKSGFIYSAVMVVTPSVSTAYTIVGSGPATPDQFEGSFTAPPSPGAGSTTLALIGDLGQTVNSSSTINHVIGNLASGYGYDAVIICGDLSYADAEHSPAKCNHPGGCSQERWDTWGKMYQALGSKAATMPLPGNHEIETEDAPIKGSAAAPGAPPADGGATTTPFLSYRTRFAAVGGATGPLYYSWEVGPLHAIHLNSYHDYIEPDAAFTKDSAQYKWLVADLAKIDRKKTPWVAVFLHAPWYNSNSHHQKEKEELGMQALYEDVFHAANVDLMFAGHVHAYERSLPVYNGVPTPGALTELNIGDGGNREGPATPYLAQPTWSAFREAIFGHGELQFTNATHAHWTWHRNQDAESVGADDVWLVKNSYLNRGDGVVTGVSHFDYAAGGGLGQEWTVGGKQFDGRKGAEQPSKPSQKSQKAWEL